MQLTAYYAILMRSNERRRMAKTLLVMKLTIFLLVAGLLQVHANVHSQSITFSGKNVPLEQTFIEIKAQTGYLVFYNKGQLKKTKGITVSVKNIPLRNFLDIILKDQPLGYAIEEQTVIIAAKPSVLLPTEPLGDPENTDVAELLDFSGTVLNTDGTPLSGATVSVKGSTKAVSANVDGTFSLTGIPADATVVISAVGFQQLEISFKKGNPVKKSGGGQLFKNATGKVIIKLELSDTKMDDVVVTGYFTRSKGSFTGAASSFTGAEIMRANPMNVLSALSILEPSFKMVENPIAGSNPNIVPDFVVRGEASLPNLQGDFKGNPNNPIFILDGFEVSAEKVFDLDPMLLGSVTVLKDAASTAIYGSRASAGVVVIETKRPKGGSINLSYNLDVTYTTPDLRDYHLLDASQKLELEKAAGYYDKAATVPEDERRQDEYNEKLALIRKGYNTYWLNKPLQRAIGQKHSLSVEGSENALRYWMNVNYEKAPGVMIGSGRDKTGIGAMLQYRHKNITFQNRLTYDNVKGLNSPYGSFDQYAKINPYFKYDDAQGNYLKSFSTGSWFLNIANPLYNSRLNVIDETAYSQFINNFSIDWYILPQLRLQGNMSVNHRKDEGVTFKPADHTDFINYPIPDSYRRGQYRSKEGTQFSYDGKIQLSYSNNFGKHVINTGIAANVQEMKGEEYSLLVEGFPDEKLDYLIFGLQYPQNSRPTGSDNISRLMGYVATANYVYDNRYLLDVSYRTDASSKFGNDNRWAPFWSVGVGRNLHNDPFFKNLTFVDKLRLRASYGVTGSQSFDPYQALTRYEYYMSDKYNYMMGATMKAMGNNSLKWQQTHQLNLGIDVGVFGFLDITANYYRKNSKSLLADITLPPSLGFAMYKENVGEMHNKGFDINIKATVYKNRNSYVNLLFGAMHNVNTIEKISNSMKAWNETQDKEISNRPRIRYIEGQSVNSIWGVPSLGINPANGKEMFLMPDGRRTDVWSPAYQQAIGVTDPDLEGNVGLNAGFKGLMASLYFRYRIGGQMYNSTLVERVENADKRYNTDVRVLGSRWQNPGDLTNFKDVRDNSPTQATSRFVEDYSFMQLSALNVSYDLNKKLISKINAKSAMISFSMNDVFRFATVKAERGVAYPFAASFRTSLRLMF